MHTLHSCKHARMHIRIHSVMHTCRQTYTGMYTCSTCYAPIHTCISPLVRRLSWVFVQMSLAATRCAVVSSALGSVRWTALSIFLSEWSTCRLFHMSRHVQRFCFAFCAKGRDDGQHPNDPYNQDIDIHATSPVDIDSSHARGKKRLYVRTSTA